MQSSLVTHLIISMPLDHRSVTCRCPCWYLHVNSVFCHNHFVMIYWLSFGWRYLVTFIWLFSLVSYSMYLSIYHGVIVHIVYVDIFFTHVYLDFLPSHSCWIIPYFIHLHHLLHSLICSCLCCCMGAQPRASHYICHFHVLCQNQVPLQSTNCLITIMIALLSLLIHLYWRITFTSISLVKLILISFTYCFCRKSCLTLTWSFLPQSPRVGLSLTLLPTTTWRKQTIVLWLSTTFCKEVPITLPGTGKL